MDLLIEEHVPVALINGIDGYDYKPMMKNLKRQAQKPFSVRIRRQWKMHAMRKKSGRIFRRNRF
ncbi:dioxygenase [Actinobacillus equuli]|nr:dioxygenase [Actinobacillus equuli]